MKTLNEFITELQAAAARTEGAGDVTVVMDDDSDPTIEWIDEEEAGAWPVWVIS